jgi:sodium-coupled monocarboxylate transporter 8/12
MWYTPIAVATVLVVGIIVSYITGSLKPNEVDPKLLIPISDVFCCCLPKRIRDWLRCGVKEDVYLEEKVCLSIKHKYNMLFSLFIKG